MARIFMLCGLLSMGLVCQGQLNYEGNPLTEAIEYTAQESQSPRLNARQRFEVADARTINLSKRPFTPSATDPLTPEETETPLSRNDDFAKYERAPETTMREIVVADKGSSLIATNDSVDTRVMSTMPSMLIEPPIEPAKPSVTMPQAETRQLRQYPMQSASAGTQRNPLFQEVPQSYHQTSRSYGTPEESPIAVNLSPQPQTPINQNSNEALSKFLNSRTPEESEMALQRFLTERERASLGLAQQSIAMNTEQFEQSTEPRVVSHDTFDNEIPSNYDNGRENLRSLPVSGLSSLPNQVTYLTRASYQPQPQYAVAKWSQNGPQSRRDTFYPGPPMKRHPAYRGPIRARTGPYAQPRIAPGPPVYLHKGLPYSGPPPLAGNHPWKKPVEVIYTKPPGSSISNHPIPISNPPAAYEDATKWFPESDKLPPQKDVYYSQLYAQSYDPHYYNYIAKTGKIKPWLYGKLGKAEEKSIWWELYTGFKNHGMKNMMNPMFLLGMTIPTLTLVLSALIQKRSAARAHTGNYDPQEFLEVYEPQIREAILAYERQMQENVPLDQKTEGLARRRRSAGRAVIAPTKKLQEKWNNEKIGARTIGPAPPGLSPFEEYFLTHQKEFAQAFTSYEKKKRQKEYEKRKKIEQMEQGSMQLASPAHEAQFPQAFKAHEKE